MEVDYAPYVSINASYRGLSLTDHTMQPPFPVLEVVSLHLLDCGTLVMLNTYTKLLMLIVHLDLEVRFFEMRNTSPPFSFMVL